MALTAAEAFREAACGRVVAMLASKKDAPEQVVRRLSSAIESGEPTVITKPVLRLDACVAMVAVGALLAFVIRDWYEAHRLASACDDAIDDAIDEAPVEAIAEDRSDT